MANGKKILPKLPKKLTPKNKLFSVVKGLGIYFLIGFAILVFIAGISGGPPRGDDTPISQIVSDVKDQKVSKLKIEGDRVTAEYKDQGKTLTTRKEAGESIYQVVKDSDIDPKSVAIEVKDTAWQNAWLSLLGTLLPIIIMVVFFFLIFRQAKDAGQGIFSFGQSRA